MPGNLSRPRKERIPPLELGGGNGAPLDVSGTLVLPLKWRRSPQEKREEIQGRATIFRVPQMSQSIPGKPVFHVLPRLSSRGSTHTMVARGTALWESLVGKPRGNDSRESHISLDPREGKRDTAATAREEIARACLHSR